jgi:serine/threonine protein kinase
VHREKKCIHKDLKPDNILISSEFKLTIIDFGISEKEHEVSCEDCLGIKGAKMFCAPEVFDESVGFCLMQRSSCTSKRDIWSFGVLLYLFLYGGHPFEANNETLLVKQIQACQ